MPERTGTLPMGSTILLLCNTINLIRISADGAILGSMSHRWWFSLCHMGLLPIALQLEVSIERQLSGHGSDPVGGYEFLDRSGTPMCILYRFVFIMGADTVHYVSGTRCGVLQLGFVLSWALARI